MVGRGLAALTQESLTVMEATHKATSDAWVWISEAETASKRDHDKLRFNRRKVRQQAMRHVVSTQHQQPRKQATIFKFVEERSKPSVAGTTDVEDQEEATIGTKRTRKSINSKVRRWVTHAPKRSEPKVLVLQRPAQTGYFAARSRYHFDILDLSLAVNVNMGRAAATALHNSRARMRDWLRTREPSFLDFIPQLYATSSLLRKIVDCVLARGQRTLAPSTRISDATVYSLYEQALKELQEALDHKDRVYDPDVLCAVQLMQLFEVLDFSQPGFWTSHTTGITKLVQMRGPRRYKGDFERSLLCSQLGTIFGEALLQNNDCFLGEIEWQETLHEIMNDPKFKLPPLLIGIWTVQVLLPRLIRQAGEVILSEGGDIESTAMLTLDFHRFRSLNEQWRVQAMGCTDAGEQDASKLPESLAIAYAGDLIANRAMVALSPLHPEAACLEAEAIDLCERIAGIVNHLRTTASRGDALIARAVQVVTMARACQDDFKNAMSGHVDYVDERTGHVKSKVWQHFNGLMGRRVLPGFIRHEDLLRELQQSECWLSTSKDKERFFDGTVWTWSSNTSSTSNFNRAA